MVIHVLDPDREAKIAIVASVTALYPLITMLLAIVFLHESLTLKQIVGFCFAIGAIVLLAG